MRRQGLAILGATLILFMMACTEVSFEEIPENLGKGLVNLDNSDFTDTTDAGDFGDSPSAPGNDPDNPTTDDPAPTTPNPVSKTINQTFTQVDKARNVDILFIVDNSSSMIEEQRRLGQRIENFLTQLSDVNWQLGITTTDVSDGTFGVKGSLLQLSGQSGYILSAATPNYQNVFLETVVRVETLDCYPACPSTDEQPLKASIMAMLKRNTQNTGFFRPDSDLAIVVLSDEDEMSTGPAAATKPIDVINVVKGLWAGAKNLAVFGLIIEPSDPNCMAAQYDSGGSYGTHVSQLAQLTTGITGSICATDYGPPLAQIGNGLRRRLNSIELSHIPIAGTLAIELSPAIPNMTWTIFGKKVTFDLPVPNGAQMHVSYKVPGD